MLTKRLFGTSTAVWNAVLSKSEWPARHRLRLPTNRLSSVGFGAFRLSERDRQAGAAALNDALRRGVNVIDTSSHFGNGESEKIIGDTLKDAERSWGLKREDIVVISKCGHILGDSSKVAEMRENPDLKAAVLSDSAAHCISPKFIESQIELSLSRLGMDKIDIYMLNCPERLLAGKIHGRQVLSVYPLIKEAFEYLESEVAKGRIGSYGIASNSISNPTVPDHVNIEQCVAIAKEVGGPDHAFTCIEYPLNLFERDAVESLDGGRVLSEIAEMNDLYQFTQRPLNVIASGSIRCLGDKKAGYDDEAKITAQLTSYFEQVTELESELSDLVGDTQQDINTVAHFIWAETLADNLTQLISSNAFATKHYVNNTVLPTLATDINTLLEEHSLNNNNSHNADHIRQWAVQYKEAITELCSMLIGLCEAAEAATNREISNVLAAMAPTAIRNWRELKFTDTSVDMFAQAPLSDLAIRLVRASLESRTGGRGGTVLVGMRKPEYVEGVVSAGSGGSASFDDVESAFLCSLLD
ncbi:NADP-dependent oxidoreductase domain-containing protein [Obelidium mucronatum]|nr:NADP-dependent oxidoreductase domain-containing protein [Obelidium mucronatum]